jgi:hypothetical protein
MWELEKIDNHIDLFYSGQFSLILANTLIPLQKHYRNASHPLCFIALTRHSRGHLSGIQVLLYS